MRGFAVGLAVLALGQQAAAADLMYHYNKGAPEVLAPYDGFAHWQLQARCSGMMKARAAYDASRGRKPDQALAGASYFADAATSRYIADRSVEEAKARAVVGYYEDKATTEFNEKVGKRGGDAGRTPANMIMTECAAVASALSPPAGAPPVLLAADPQKERMICEVYEPTGSRLAKRICRTKAEIDQMAREARDNTARIQELGGCRDGRGCQ